MQQPAGVDLRAQHAAQLLVGERGRHAVVDDAGGMHHRGQRMVRGDRVEEFLDRRPVRHVTGHEPGVGPGSGQLRQQLVRSFGRRAPAAGEQQVPGSVRPGEVAGDEPAEGTGGAGQQDGAVRVDRGGRVIVGRRGFDRGEAGSRISASRTAVCGCAAATAATSAAPDGAWSPRSMSCTRAWGVRAVRT